mmetsp:Transcript_26154/g.44090  ORF Transcript_26154/g.44090 Transcript_26154/m.44090 type:complete len:466 (+) Transcript_26154:21-1418(+)
MFRIAYQRVASPVVLSIGAISTFAYLTRRDTNCSKDGDKHVVIIGAGTGGIGVNAMLRNEGFKNVTLIEPKEYHEYQPLWSLVGGGVKPVEQSRRMLNAILPSSTKWVQKSVVSKDPENNMVKLSDGSTISYDYLVVAAGIQQDWSKTPGLKDAIEDKNSGVVSIYDYKYAQKTWEAIQGFKGGRAIFTMPATPIKCPGAPQKIMWLFEERMRDMNIRDKTNVEFWVPGGAMFGVKRYADMLAKQQAERGVIPQFKQVLVAVDGKNRNATFKNLETGKTTTESYDLLHAVPQMPPPEFVRTAPLANAQGFIEVDKHTLQSTKYANVFALGDCTNTPNSKTAAAITKQAPILVHNLQRVMAHQEPNAKYDGYASCPLIISKKEVILAEFGYGGKIMETFSRDTGKFPYKYIGSEGALQRRFFFWMKEMMFPYVYWTLWPRGAGMALVVRSNRMSSLRRREARPQCR